MHGTYAKTKSLVPGITGTSAAFIDVSFIMIMVLLFVVAVLKVHAPEPVSVDVALPARGKPADAMPLTSIEIFPEGVVVGDNDLVAFDHLGRALEQVEIGEGTIGLCVSKDASYHQFRNVVAIVQSKLGPRQWTDCGGSL